jgi:DNA-binding response OmpR family regulator
MEPSLQPRLLVVDDEEPIRFAMHDFFSAQGYEVDCAAEKEAALALLARRRYSLMLADLRLAGTTGRQGLELVALARGRRPELRIVVLTAHGSAEAEAEARRLGADAFLHKPMSLPDLRQVVVGLVGA